MQRILHILSQHAITIVLGAAVVFLGFIVIFGLPVLSEEAADAVIPQTNKTQVDEQKYQALLQYQETRLAEPQVTIHNPF